MSELSTSAVRQLYESVHRSLVADAERMGHMGIRHGYFDDDHTTEGQAVANLRHQLADRIDINENDTVLDIGCGFGADARWFATEIGATVHAIDISDRQLAVARSKTNESTCASRVRFELDDFHELETVDDDSVTVVWSVEALCHATDLERAISQVARVLEDGGRFAVADVFLTPDADPDARPLRRYRDGLMTDPPQTNDFRETLTAKRFEAVDVDDITEATLPSVRRLWRFGLWAYPYFLFKGLLPHVDEIDPAIPRGFLNKHRAIREDLLMYAFVTAEY